MNRKTGVLLSYILMIFEILSTLLLTPFIIRTLGQAEYGVYKLAAAVNAYLLLLDLGAGNAVTRFVAKYRATSEKEKSEKFLGVATLYYAFIAILTVIIGIVIVLIFPHAFSAGLTPEETSFGQKLLLITMINSCVTLGTSAYTNTILAYERFAVSKGSSIIQILLRVALTYLVLKLGLGSIGIVTVNLLMTVLCRGFFVYYVLVHIKLKLVFKKIEVSFVKEIIAYSTWILLQMIATQINASVDQILIGSLVSSSAVILAVYGVGTQIVQYFQSIGSAFTGVLMPGIVRMVEEGAPPKQLTDEMVRIGRIIFMVLGIILSGFAICGKQFVVLWAGEANEQAYYVTLILMVAYILYLTESVGGQILWAKNEHREQSILKLAIVCLNVILTVFLIRWEPLIGATIGTFVSIILGDVVVMNIIFKKKLRINLLRYYKGLFKGIVTCLFISVVAGVLIHGRVGTGWIPFIIEVCVICVVYVVSMYLFGMNQYEKNLCKSIFSKMWRK